MQLLALRVPLDIVSLPCLDRHEIAAVFQLLLDRIEDILGRRADMVEVVAICEEHEGRRYP